MSVQPLARLLTVSNVAEAAQVSEWTVRQEIRAGNLKARRIRGCVRITEGAYAEWAEIQREAS